ncbi:ABC transporter permease [Variovorax sp. LjRoot175]|uniref:ABC transporter permease n=1 Tax=Variovorax sp. LjRoot175 TaxID=3342276 RepID=UPI003ECC6B75
MLAFFLRRLLSAVAVLAVVAFVAFGLFQYVGDPVTQMLGPDATEADRARVRQELHLDEAFPLQFARFAGRLVHGELGVSLRQGRPVRDLLAERLPATLELSLVAAASSVAVGLLLGVLCAVQPDGMLAKCTMALSLVGASLPTFLIGILLILVFSVLLGVLPSYGRGELVAVGWWKSGLLTADGWRHLVMPATTLALFQLALIVRLSRAEMMEVLRTDYIRFARARGVRERAILYRHALRNALIPVVTIVGLQLGAVVAFAVVTETVFQWPGVGALFVDAIGFADTPVIAAYLCFVAVMYVVINFAVDLLYFAIDPRLKVT